MLVAHISDTHLGYRQYGLSEREEDIYQLFMEAIEKIQREKPDILVHTGDLFDNPRPSTRTLLVAYNGLKKLVEKGIRVYCIVGDYELSRSEATPPHALLERLGVIRLVGSKSFSDKPYIELELNGYKTLLAGVQYIPRRLSKSLVETLRGLGKIAEKYRRSILMLHQGLKEYSPRSYELRLEDMPKGFNYYALGHVHARTWFRYGAGVAGYAGSIDVMDVSEWEDYQRNGKGFYLVDLSTDTPILHKVDLEGIRKHFILEIDYQLLEEELRKLAQRLTSEKLKPLLYLTIRNGSVNRPHVYRLLMNVIQDRVLWWRIQFKEKFSRTRGVDELEKIDVKELLEKSLGDREEAELAYKLLELLGRGDLEAALELTRKYYEEKW